MVRPFPSCSSQNWLGYLLDFAEDRNGFVDFSEYLVLSKMFHGHFSNLDKARFWWWVALYTDGDSAGGDKTAKTMVSPLC